MLRIGDVAEATGLTQRAIRYYEELGLLETAARRNGANRRYEQHEVERLALIKRLREDVGLSLAEVQMYLDVEDLRDVLKSEFDATAEPAQQLTLLDRAEPIIRRRVALLERKVALIAALRAEDVARLERITTLRRDLTQSLAREPHGSLSPATVTH